MKHRLRVRKPLPPKASTPQQRKRRNQQSSSSQDLSHGSGALFFFSLQPSLVQRARIAHSHGSSELFVGALHVSHPRSYHNFSDGPYRADFAMHHASSVLCSQQRQSTSDTAPMFNRQQLLAAPCSQRPTCVFSSGWRAKGRCQGSTQPARVISHPSN